MMPVLAMILAYLLGSLPVGVLICRVLGKDPRTKGSGRTGGTNVYRTAGLVPALLTVVGDVAKGWLALWLAQQLVPGPAQVLALSLAGLAAILGHNYSLFLGFRGGAGATPDLGATLFLDLPVALAALGVGAAGLFGLRIASVGTLAASVTVLVGLVLRVVTASGPYAQPAVLLFGVGQLALIVLALRPNLARLRSGSERRVSFGAPGRGDGRGTGGRDGNGRGTGGRDGNGRGTGGRGGDGRGTGGRDGDGRGTGGRGGDVEDDGAGTMEDDSRQGN